MLHCFTSLKFGFHSILFMNNHSMGLIKAKSYITSINDYMLIVVKGEFL